MGSRKNKEKDKDRDRDKKKRKHRSRSREAERESKDERHRNHKHKRHRSKRPREDRSPSVSGLTSCSDDNTILKEERKGLVSEPICRQPDPSPPRSSGAAPNQGGGGESSLSIEESNKLRAKLGLKPLQFDSPGKKDAAKEGEVEEYKLGQFVHKPAENLSDKIQVEKLREKFAAQREKRRLKEKMAGKKTLGDSDSEDDSALGWVERSRKLERAKEEAAKKARILEELDEQFGIGDLLQEEVATNKKNKYSGKDLLGAKVLHDVSRFQEGRSMILTLQDANVLADDEDTLVNVDVIDMERAEKNVRNRARKPDSKEYETPEVDPETGRILHSSVLTKYDEEINGMKETSFRLGIGGRAVPTVKTDDRGTKGEQLRRELQRLDTPAAQLATEYLTPAEVAAASFRKVKRRKRKKFNVDDLEIIQDGVLEGAKVERLKSLRQLMAEQDDDGQAMDVDASVIDDDEEDDVELQEALARSRRTKLAQRSQAGGPTWGPESLSEVLAAPRRNTAPMDVDALDTGADVMMTLNTTDEFCRTLGEIPTYGLAGNRMAAANDEDDEAALGSGVGGVGGRGTGQGGEGDARGTWEEVGIDETRVEIGHGDSVAPILEEEPETSRGVANALKLALKKGYLEKCDSTKPANAGLQHLRAINYSIDDKAGEDDRSGGRGGGRDRYAGPTVDFKDKDGYRPEIKLDYVDDDGHKLSSKEAFRYLSHKFHGKGSGKNKLEKRMKKYAEEAALLHMSSGDTPLQAVALQRLKQKQLGTAYLVLSGGKPQQEGMDVSKK